MKTKKKTKKVKPRVKIAPPSKRHKTKKDYNRKENNKVADLVLEEEICQTPSWITEELCGCTIEKGCLDLPFDQSSDDLRQELIDQAKEENKHAGSSFQDFTDEQDNAIKNLEKGILGRFWNKILKILLWIAERPWRKL